jgi:hypothetical protein
MALLQPQMSGMPDNFNHGRPRWWQWLTVLSLDAPLVAILWQALFASLVDVRLPWHDPVLLGLAVWMVYAADRWIEGLRLEPEIVQTSRHLFYIRHRWPVFWTVVVVAMVTVVIALRHLESMELKAGVMLVVPTLLYLFSHQLLHRHHPLRLPKEICIAVIFSLGCALAPVVHAPDRWMLLLVPSLLFCLLCFANCALISLWEKEVDFSHGQTSLAWQIGKAARFIHSLPWLAMIAGGVLWAMSEAVMRPALVCVATSGGLLGLLDSVQPTIGRLHARAAIDFTMMTPVFVILMEV